MASAKAPKITAGVGWDVVPGVGPVLAAMSAACGCGCTDTDPDDNPCPTYCACIWVGISFSGLTQTPLVSGNVVLDPLTYPTGTRWFPYGNCDYPNFDYGCGGTGVFGIDAPFGPVGKPDSADAGGVDQFGTPCRIFDLGRISIELSQNEEDCRKINANIHFDDGYNTTDSTIPPSNSLFDFIGTLGAWDGVTTTSFTVGNQNVYPNPTDPSSDPAATGGTATITLQCTAPPFYCYRIYEATCDRSVDLGIVSFVSSVCTPSDISMPWTRIPGTNRARTIIKGEACERGSTCPDPDIGDYPSPPTRDVLDCSVAASHCLETWDFSFTCNLGHWEPGTTNANYVSTICSSPSLAHDWALVSCDGETATYRKVIDRGVCTTAGDCPGPGDPPTPPVSGPSTDPGPDDTCSCG